MDLSVQSQLANVAVRNVAKNSPEPVNQREGTEAPAKREVIDEATLSARAESLVPTGVEELADYDVAQEVSSSLSSAIPAEPGMALGAQAQLATENALALLR